MKSLNCNKCGKPIDKVDKFCPHCGAPISKTTTTPKTKIVKNPAKKKTIVIPAQKLSASALLKWIGIALIVGLIVGWIRYWILYFSSRSISRFINSMVN